MTAAPREFRVLFVCLANVCRSPMAEAVLRCLGASQRRLSLQVDSAGCRVANPGTRPDARAEAALIRRGYPVRRGRSRALVVDDFERFDAVLAMDERTLADAVALCPARHRHKVRLFLEHAPGLAVREVPDPYFGGTPGFEQVLDLCEAGSHGLLAWMTDVAPGAASARS